MGKLQEKIDQLNREITEIESKKEEKIEMINQLSKCREIEDLDMYSDLIKSLKIETKNSVTYIKVNHILFTDHQKSVIITYLKNKNSSVNEFEFIN